MRLCSLFATALVASVATAQVTIPAHFSVYNGFSRGMNFTAATPFTITQLELPVISQQVGDTAGFLVRINGVTTLRSVGNVGPLIATSIPVITGDVVDVIGNWSPAVTGNFTAHNSYGSATAGAGAGPFATTILGVPHTLNRTGWQWDIGDAGYLSGAYLAPVAGQIGRINMYVNGASGTVLATNTPLGAGCGASTASFYENFATAAAFDLGNTAFSMIPSSGYVVINPLGALQAVGATPTTLVLGDDTEATYTFVNGFTAPGWGAGVTVCSNGYVSKATGNGTGFTPTVATFLAGSQDWFSIGWHDFNPAIAGSGQVKVDETATNLTITWDGVWDFGGTSATNASTIQFQLNNAGQVTFAYGTMSTLGNGFLTGFSPGGVSLDPGNTNISATPTLTLELTDVPALNLAALNRPIQMVAASNWNLNATNLPAGLGIDIIGLNDAGIPDLSLLGLGMPGCSLRATLDIITGPFIAGGAHAWSFTIPGGVPSLVNIELYVQNAVLDFSVNLALTKTTNGIKGKIGDF